MEVIRHRGPDDSGVCGFSLDKAESFPRCRAKELKTVNYMDGFFGFNRLSIRDLSIEGHQPMLSEDKKVILIYNGEIYNDNELRSELKMRGGVFKPASDTEVILKMYLTYGFEAMVKRLNGMFAIAIMDLRTGMFYLARDRYGVKPLYYTVLGNELIFASEFKAIIQFREFPKELEKKTVVSLLSLLSLRTDVLMKNIWVVEPGQALMVNYGGEIKAWNYFDVDAYMPLEASEKKDKDMLDDMATILQSAVKRQMVSDVKVGCQVSGGVDSTLVSYYASKIKGGTLEDGFSIIDKNEEKYIDQVGIKCDLNLHKYIVPYEYFIDNYERTIWHYEGLLYNTGLPSYLRMIEQASNDVTVLLCGEGADETTGGYANFAYGVLQPFMSRFEQNGKLSSYPSYADYIIRINPYAKKLILIDGAEDEIENIVENKKHIFNHYQGSNFTKHRKYEMTQSLSELLTRQDKLSMACSVETRVPMLDNEVFDYVMRLPENMLVRFASESPFDIGTNPFDWVQGKYIYKELVRKEFGYEFAYRKKTFMTTVSNAENWISSRRFKEYFYDVVLDGMKKRNIVNWKAVVELFDNLATINGLQFELLWRTIGLETWCQLFLDGRSRA